MRSSPISKAKRGREVHKLSIRAQRQKPLNEAHQPTLAPRAAKTRHRPGTSERSLPAVPILVTGRSANRRLGVPNPRHPVLCSLPGRRRHRHRPDTLERAWLHPAPGVQSATLDA